MNWFLLEIIGGWGIYGENYQLIQLRSAFGLI